MPSCIIKGCAHTWRDKGKNIIMHVFPKDRRIVRKWIEQAPDHFPNVDEWVEKIMDSKKTHDNYRMCSKHFEDSAYEEGGLRKKLRPYAVPTIFTKNLESAQDSSDATAGTVKKRPATSESFMSSDSRSATPSAHISGETQAAAVTVPTLPSTSSVRRRPKKRKVTNMPVTQVRSDPVISTGNAVMTGEINLLGSTIQLHLPLTAIVTDSDVRIAGPSQLSKEDKSTNTDLYWSKDHNAFVLGTSFSKNVNIGIQTQKINSRKRGTRVTKRKVPIIEKTAMKTDKAHFNETDSSDNGHSELSSEEDTEQSNRSDNSNNDSVNEEIEGIERSPSVFLSTPSSASKMCNRKEIPHMSPLKKTRNRIGQKIELAQRHEGQDEIEEDPQFTPVDISEEEEDEDLSPFIDDFDDEIEPLEEVTTDPDQMDIIGADIKDPVADKKFLVFQSCLESLVSMIPCQYRKTCGSKLTHMKIREIGSAINLDVKCVHGHLDQLWTSQPRVNRIPAGNLILSSAIVLNGSHFQKINNFFQLINVSMISKSTHYRNQPKYIFPVISEVWQKERAQIISTLGRRPVCLSGDGQSDSSGFLAKYCIYTMMETDLGKILDFSVQQIIPPANSVSLQKKAFKDTIERIIASKVNVRIVSTDRHVDIRKLMKEEYPRIRHKFDVWHLAKSVGQKLLTSSKTKHCASLSPWIPSIKNHLWWCSRNCDADPAKLIERWKSILKHVRNIHEWESDNDYSRCHHQTGIEDIKWLTEDSTAYDKLKSIVNNQSLLKDIEHLCFFCHTDELEFFHSSVRKYRPKRVHFYYDAMVARTTLAVLDHNSNVGRVQAVLKGFDDTEVEEQEKPYRFEYSKARKALVVKILYEPHSQEFLKPILSRILDFAEGKIESTWQLATHCLPKNIALVERPPKEDLARRHLLRK